MNNTENSTMNKSDFNIQAEKQKFEALQVAFQRMVVREKLKATDWNVSIPSELEDMFINYMDDHEIVYNVV